MKNIRGIISDKVGSWKVHNNLETILPYELKENNILVKMHLAPVNPSDMMSRLGYYVPQKEVPYIGGLEGYGEVVKVGKKENEHMIGKKGYCLFAGRYGSYA